jgi:DNA-directed RNA polymerase specialized sigma24 family protein
VSTLAAWTGDDAADVLAETFLTAWRRLDDVPHGESTRPPDAEGLPLIRGPRR